MRGIDIHTNIMLDLECTDANAPNPVILEIAAVHFDLNTGEELGHLSTPVNFEDCVKHDCVTDPETMKWLADTIPKTLQASRETPVTLQNALFKFNNFIRNAVRITKRRLDEQGEGFREDKSQTMVWGNGSAADNVWMRSAYKSCGWERPWKYYNDMCTRTFVKQIGIMLDRNFQWEEKFIGIKHVALDDCRHQISYMVKARNALMSVGATRQRRTMLQSPDTSFSSVEAGREDDRATKPAPSNQVQGCKGMLTPSTSFSTSNEQESDQVLASMAALKTPINPRRNGLSTPSTSFTTPDEKGEQIISSQTTIIFDAPLPDKLGLLSPETSFSADDEGDPALTNVMRHEETPGAGKEFMDTSTAGSTCSPLSPTKPRSKKWFS